MQDTVGTGLSSDDISQADFGLVPPEMTQHLWPRVEQILLTRGARWLAVVSEADVYRLLITGNADLWCGMQSGELDVIAICMWERHARAQYYHVCFVGGTDAMKYLAKGLQTLERYASIMGAAELTLEGRKGLARILKPFGYGSTTVRLRKPVKVLWRN